MRPDYPAKVFADKRTGYCLLVQSLVASSSCLIAAA